MPLMQCETKVGRAPAAFNFADNTVWDTDQEMGTKMAADSLYPILKLFVILITGSNYSI